MEIITHEVCVFNTIYNLIPDYYTESMHTIKFDTSKFNHTTKMFILRGDLQQHLDTFTNLGFTCTTEVPIPWLASDLKIEESIIQAEKAWKISITSSDRMNITIKPSKIPPNLLDYFFKNEDVSLIDAIIKVAEPNKEYEVATITTTDRQFTIATMVIKVLPKQKRFFNFFEEDEASIMIQFTRGQGCY